MGDRCYCSLRVRGALSNAGLAKLGRALEDTGADAQADAVSDLLAGDSTSFTEVNNGNIEDGLHAVLTGLGLSYVWANGPGIAYPEGCALYDARTGETAEYATLEGEIVLPLGEIAKPGRLEGAQRWQDFMDSPFAVERTESVPASQRYPRLHAALRTFLTETETEDMLRPKGGHSEAVIFIGGRLEVLRHALRRSRDGLPAQPAIVRF